ncbi:MAG: hypothetical protein EP338_09910 [Bacteroidetes bacterium]|nr:MAG: hypothetical protein EP338_09910 [Bacteroidota bacterium]
MYKTFIVLLIFLSAKGVCQETDEFKMPRQNRGLEFSLMPTLLHAKLHLGYHFHGSRGKEHVINGNLLYFPFSIFVIPERVGYDISYSLNHILSPNQLYFPTWFRFRDIRQGMTSLDGDFRDSPDRLIFALGTGIGKVSQLKNNFFFRSELAIGAAFWLFKYDRDIWPFKFDFSGYSAHEASPIFPFLNLHLGFVYKFEKSL